MSQPAETRQESNRFKIRRSVVLGLGGTGRNVCTQLKRILLEQSDNDPARFGHVRLLSIDTDARVKRLETEQGERVELDRRELMGLRIPPSFDSRRLQRVLSEEQASYLPQANELGAMRSRPIGNAFLLVNWRAIRERVKDLIYELSRSDLRAMVRTDPRYRGMDLATNKIDLYVVGNLVSGTGSGMALGLGYLLRDLTAELADGNTEYHSEGIFTVCGVYAMADYAGQPSPYAVNCYAALLELNHFSNREGFATPGEGYDPGFDPILFSQEARKQAPYDFVQLLNPSHSSAGELSHEQLEPHLAQVLALRIGSEVGMIATAKVVDEFSNRPRYDAKGNLRFCWAWGANTFRSAGQQVLDLATLMAADETLDALTGEHVRAAINLKDEAWGIVRGVGFGYSDDDKQASLLKSLLTTQDGLDDLPAGVELRQVIERMIGRKFPQPPEDEPEVIRSLPAQIDLKKGEVSLQISGLISSVVAANRRRLAQEIRDAVEADVLRLADYSEDGKGSLRDAVEVVDLLVGSGAERIGLLARDSDAYQEAVHLAVGEGRKGRREADVQIESVRNIVATRGRFNYQALVGAWDRFVKGLIQEKVSEARQVALEEARKILDGDGADKNDTLRLGLIRHLEVLRTRLRAARDQVQRLDSRFETRIERLERSLRERGEDNRRIAEALDLKTRVLDGEKLRLCARQVVDEVLGPPHEAVGRYDEAERLDQDYAKVDEILRAKVLEVGAGHLAASIEESPDFDGHLETLLERAEPAIRLDPNRDEPPEVAYLSVPPGVPTFVSEVQRTGWLEKRAVANKQDDELFQERLDDTEPRVDVLVGKLTFSPASIHGIDRWAGLYGRATVGAEGRRSVHTVPDAGDGARLYFEDLGQTGTRVLTSYLVARSLLWLTERDGRVVYEYPQGGNSFLQETAHKVLGGSFGEAGLLEAFKRPLEAGVSDRETGGPAFLHAHRRFRRAMGAAEDPDIRARLFGRLVIGVAQVARGTGELGADPHLPRPRTREFQAFENGLRSLLEPLGLAAELIRRVRELEPVPSLGDVGALGERPAEDAPTAPAAPPPRRDASYDRVVLAVPPEATGRDCPNGHPVAEGAKFCPACGEKVPTGPEPHFCAACGFAAAPEDRFCSRCGAAAPETVEV